MVWTTVSSRSCFCWLYRTSPPLAAKSIISLIILLKRTLLTTAWGRSWKGARRKAKRHLGNKCKPEGLVIWNAFAAVGLAGMGTNWRGVRRTHRQNWVINYTWGSREERGKLTPKLLNSATVCPILLSPKEGNTSKDLRWKKSLLKFEMSVRHSSQHVFSNVKSNMIWGISMSVQG